MAKVNSNTGEYIRFMLKDSAQVGLFNKVFIAEQSRDKDMRDNKGVYEQPKYLKFDFSPRWRLEITGATTLDEIAAECYACLDQEPEFSAENGWESDEVVE